MKAIVFFFAAMLFVGSPVIAQTDSTLPAPVIAHQTLIERTFDNFEAMMFAPLRVDQRTLVAGVKAVCQSVQESLTQLVSDAEARESLPLPDSLEEMQELNRYLATRFRALQLRMVESGEQIQISGQIVETNCPELNAQQGVAQDAMQRALKQYGPQGWCSAMMDKPQADWAAQEADTFARACQGVTAN